MLQSPPSLRDATRTRTRRLVREAARALEVSSRFSATRQADFAFQAAMRQFIPPSSSKLRYYFSLSIWS
jgi:hypothetical protein